MMLAVLPTTQCSRQHVEGKVPTANLLIGMRFPQREAWGFSQREQEDPVRWRRYSVTFQILRLLLKDRRRLLLPAEI